MVGVFHRFAVVISVKYICPRCMNKDVHFFYHGSKGWYCRKCISFKRIFLDETLSSQVSELSNVDSEYHLGFALTSEQVKISKQILHLLKAKKSVLVSAICGAGKTELVYAAIAYYLKQHKRVAFAISRRQVVLQVAKRLQRDFPNLKVIPVCEGYTTVVDGDLIVCTTHQLYRYTRTFDLLIIDEPDAYPYVGNDVLQSIAINSCKGEIVYLSATPDESLKQKVLQKKLYEITLSIRPSKRPLAIPKCVYLPKALGYVYLVYWIYCCVKKNRQCFVFLPTIHKVMLWKWLLKKHFLIDAITSKTEDKEKILDAFENKSIHVLLCTTILERGITFEGIDVVVMECEHRVFTESSLIQIMGRVARGVKDTSGEGVFIVSKRCQKIEGCIGYIHLNNANAFGAEKI